MQPKVKQCEVGATLACTRLAGLQRRSLLARCRQNNPDWDPIIEYGKANMRKLTLIIPAAWLAMSLSAAEYHVSVAGRDANDGSAAKPFNSISAAALRAQAGDVITVHAGIYRERI